MAREPYVGNRPEVENLASFVSTVVSGAGYQCECSLNSVHFYKRCPNRMGGRDRRGRKVSILIKSRKDIATNNPSDWMAVCSDCVKSCKSA